MLSTPTHEAKLALRRLQNTDDGFNKILDWLRDSREQAVKAMANNRCDVIVRQSQGCIQTLDRLFEEVEKARR